MCFGPKDHCCDWWLPWCRQLCHGEFPFRLLDLVLTLAQNGTTLTFIVAFIQFILIVKLLHTHVMKVNKHRHIFNKYLGHLGNLVDYRR
jgi:hypothetical protein